MDEDIVTRLRNWDDQQPPFAIMHEAAFEIESLREELSVLFDGVTIMLEKLKFLEKR